MGGNYEKSMYNQLMDVMARLDTVERESKKEISHLNDELSDLKKENRHLREENQLLKDDNARLKSILNHDSSNTSQPPSTDQKGGFMRTGMERSISRLNTAVMLFTVQMLKRLGRCSTVRVLCRMTGLPHS